MRAVSLEAGLMQLEEDHARFNDNVAVVVVEVRRACTTDTFWDVQGIGGALQIHLEAQGCVERREKVARAGNGLENAD